MTRIFGSSNIQLAEDIVQETLIAALNNWSTEGPPENPPAWLMQVAKRKALNELKHNKMVQEHNQAAAYLNSPGNEINNLFLQGEIEDSQLRMIFTCCHPSLSTESQISLTLKTLCGFGVKEVANALLTSESTINKRLYRAKTSIRDSNIPFEIPQGAELYQRLETVSLALYLMFNEGYNSTLGDTIIQKGLCLEAMRLTQLLIAHFPENKQLSALLALMCFHTARFEARLDNHGAIILFEDQNRNLWNKELINVGMRFLGQSANDETLSAYHIEANIAAEHCMATSFESTNWQNIYKLYELLEKLKPNPIIRLNLAIIQSKIVGVEASLVSLNALTKNGALKNYHLLPATQGVFELMLNNPTKALVYLKKAKALKPSPSESKIILNKIQECEALLK